MTFKRKAACLIFSVALLAHHRPLGLGSGCISGNGSSGYFLPGLGTSFHDFAGFAVAHTIGGFIALACSIVLGPRLERKFKRGASPMMPHDLAITAADGLPLWFGWYGFNPGSTLSAMDI
jgi:Amt family ammonium transporter